MKPHKKPTLLMREVYLLGTGIFTDYSPAVVKFPTCIVHVLETDNNCNIWFIMRKPFENIDGLATSFYGKMELFNRLHPFFIIAHGNVILHQAKYTMPEKIARIINSNEEVAVAMHLVGMERYRTRKKTQECSEYISQIILSPVCG